jgi:hypothetical protein
MEFARHDVELSRIGEKQIPFGNDRKKSKGKSNSRFPSGMTERKARARARARATARATATADSLRE